MLFAIITGPTLAQAKISLDQAFKKVQGIELRLDYFHPFSIFEIKELITAYPHFKFLLTLRAERQGGKFRGTEEKRLQLLEELGSIKPDYLDLEYDVPHSTFQYFADKFPHTQLICSYHDFSHTPSDLDGLYERIKNPYAQIVKIAVTSKAITDALKLVHFVRTHSRQNKLIGISMGEHGVISRILGPVAGNYFDYASIDQSTAPGQLSVEEMQNPYRHHLLNGQTSLYGLIGHPVDKSLGHVIHNLVFDQNQINAVYVKMDVLKEELEQFITIAKQLPFEGLSVTMPLKEAIFPYLDELSANAKAIGAVNTIKIEKGKWIGENTDGIAALNAIETKIAVNKQRIIVMGAGGAAKAIIYEAVQRGAQVTVVNRTGLKALNLAAMYGCRGGGLDLLPEIAKEGYEVFINTIPEGELIDEEWILSNCVVMDIVYIPKNTPFLLKASRKNCSLVFGYEMFVDQAIQQQLIWQPKILPSQLRQIIDCYLQPHL